MSNHDAQMPKEWHFVKSVLLAEMQTADTFQHCIDVANALFHARLVGQRCYRAIVADAESNGAAPARGGVTPSLGGEA